MFRVFHAAGRRYLIILRGGRLPQEENAARPGPATRSAFASGETLLKWLAIAAALVTALGYPAVIVQFVWHGIPAAFIDKELAIRAGTLPAVILILISWALLYSVRTLSMDEEMRDWMRRGHVAKVYAGIIVGFCVLRLMAAATKSALALIGNLHMPRNISGLTFDAMLLVTVALIVLVILLALTPLSALIRYWRMRNIARIERGVLAMYRVPWQSLHRMKPLSLVIVSWVAVGAISLLSGWWQLSISGPVPAAWLAGESAFEWINIVAVFSTFPFLFAVTAQAALPEELPADIRRRLQMELRAASVALAYIPLVIVYSLEWYPALPSFLGGGKPPSATLWVEAKSLPKFAPSKLTRLKVVTEGDTLRFEKCFLIHANSDIVILSDSDDPYASTLVLPRDAVRAFASPR
jgi:hypothetical protein